MFTGIVTAIGQVRFLGPIGSGRDARLEIAAPWPDMHRIAIGASIACAGCCLTVVETGTGWFAVEVSAETLAHTTLGTWREGTAVNLERSLRLGDELGGHIVSGHVDGRAELISAAPENGSRRLVLRAPRPLARFIAAKGSVTLDGVSLTVNTVRDDMFGVNVIPHTDQVTTFHARAPGDALNLEIDLLARYVARLSETGAGEHA
jgi:riboflavin synthase